jgi:signal transduction histidine kinase
VRRKLRNPTWNLKKQIATKNKFFSIISHDLKNPISVLVGFTELLLNNHKQYSDAERQKMYQTIFSTSEKTYKLLENLLSWARTQTNNIPVKSVKFDIKPVLDENIVLINAALKEIEVIKEYGSHMVLADYEMVNTIVRNLLSNAIKFTPRAGKVFVKAEAENTKLNVSITDTGVGIPENRIDSLFQIGKTISTKGTEKETGTGLGLILCAEFIARNNGEISVESKPGQGKYLYFYLTLCCLRGSNAFRYAFKSQHLLCGISYPIAVINSFTYNPANTASRFQHPCILFIVSDTFWSIKKSLTFFRFSIPRGGEIVARAPFPQYKRPFQ